MRGFKNRFLTKVLSVFIMLALLAGSVFTGNYICGENINASAANEYGLAENTADGVILHAWCWSFNTIKNNMKLIAQAGYTSIQTSPINECIVGDNGALSFSGHWYYHYQPTNYTIGNYQLGTEAEFKAMCEEAHKYGIKIIVDVVSNHMTSDWNSINSSWKNSSYFHGNTGISNWNNRYDVTQNALLGLWDLNTQSGTVQQRILTYLKQCVADGADGFRYDAAKHIELPDDSGFGSNYWPVVLNNGSAFQYGEILSDSISRDSAYAKYMRITASSFGYVVREQVAANNLSADRLSQYYVDGVSADRLVTWVESHDNYCDDVSVYMNNNDLRFAWAIVASRANSTPLFFSRPKNGGSGVMFPEQSRIGDRGDDLFFDNTIVAVNRFHNAMAGQSESMKNYNGNTCLIIERGNKGMVIVNKGGNQNLYTSTSLANGTYTDQVSGAKFTVSNGYISGNINGSSVAVIYNADTSYEQPSTPESTSPSENTGLTVHFKRTDWGGTAPYIYAYTNSGAQVTAGWPGTLMSADSKEGSGWYTYNNSSYTAANVMFNMGASSTNRDPGDGQPGYAVSGEVWYYNGSFYTSNPEKQVTPTEPSTEKVTEPETQGSTDLSGLTIHFKRNDWGGAAPYIYAYTDGGAQVTAGWPGTLMSADSKEGSGWYIYNNSSYTTANVIFNMGASSTNRDPGDGQPGYPITGEAWYYNGTWYTSNPEVVETQPETQPQKTTYTVTFMDGSSVISTATYNKSEAYSFANAPSYNGKIFAGWFTTPVTLNSEQAVKNALAYKAEEKALSDDTTLYAGWIEADKNSFDLLGAQIRIAEPSGLRFITKIGVNLIAELEALNNSNAPLRPDSISDKGIGYGTVVTLASNAEGSELVKNVNAVNIKEGMAVVPAVNLYDRTAEYLSYTAVVKNIPSSAYKLNIAARPYITYKDANGREHTYYYTESGSPVGKGYAISVYKAAEACYDKATESEKAWLKSNILK